MMDRQASGCRRPPVGASMGKGGGGCRNLLKLKRDRKLREVRSLREDVFFRILPAGRGGGGVFCDPDCMHCLRCVERCPKHALKLEKSR